MAFYNEIVDGSTFGFYFCGEPMTAFSVFATGYRRAAETLSKSLLRKPGFSKFEAYPVVFLYRHALELSLKHALYKAAEFAGYSDISNFYDRLYNGHNLSGLAKIVADSLPRLFPDDLSLQQLLSRIIATSRELDDIDARSFVSRYPIDTKGQPASNKSEFVTLRLFARHMSSLLEDLDNLNVALDNETHIAQDAFTEWFRMNLDYLP